MKKKGNFFLPSLLVSLLGHIAILCIVFPVQKLQIDPRAQFEIPVKIRLDTPIPESPQTQGAPDAKDKPVSVPVPIHPKIIQKESVKSLVQVAKPSLSGGEIHPLIAVPGDRMVATTLNAVVPIYPKQALNNNWEGTVVVDVKIDSNGKPYEVELVSSSGHDILDKAFVTTVKRYYRFAPRRLFGQDVESNLRLSYRYELGQ